jgi:hypothetical protein
MLIERLGIMVDDALELTRRCARSRNGTTTRAPPTCGTGESHPKTGF